MGVFIGVAVNYAWFGVVLCWAYCLMSFLHFVERDFVNAIIRDTAKLHSEQYVKYLVQWCVQF